MKKLMLTVFAAIIAAAMVSAQDVKVLTETYNNGATALSLGQKSEAISFFQQALELAKALPDNAQAKDIEEKCNEHIPIVQFSIAKDFVNAADYDNAVAELQKTIETAKAFKDETTATEAKDLIPQVLMQKGNALLQAKDFGSAAEAYKAVVAETPANGLAYLRLGSALNAAGDKEGAVDAFLKAVENGQEKAANKQLSTFYLKEAAAELKAKKPADAVANALKSNEYLENAKAYQIAGQASQIQGKNADAIQYFDKYLELAPTAGNAGQIAFTVGAIYQKQGNNAKAKEYYQKAVGDPKFGVQAQELLKNLK
ncbi:MAG: tetratricopeptide repeat protein [Bacteroidales bacterium]|nr:tetratricopeptide repeat protein [Bacteroidales bacterium]